MKSLLARIDEKTYEELKLVSQSTGKPMADLVREAIGKYLKGEPLGKADQLFELSGRISERRGAGKEHDKYVYAKKNLR